MDRDTDASREGIHEPVPHALGVVLRRAALDHGRAEHRRGFPPLLHVGFPGGAEEVFAIAPGDRPFASPLARAQVARGDQFLVALRHMMVNSIDDAGRHLLTLLDGTRTIDDLIAAMSAHLGVAPAALEHAVPKTLEAFGRRSLLMR
jgi:hypothetical protein